jgi:hypothetical protein
MTTQRLLLDSRGMMVQADGMDGREAAGGVYRSAFCQAGALCRQSAARTRRLRI